jgi:glycosyltransferase involved in cell wall biosynthesis
MRILYVTQIVPYPPHGGVLQRGFHLLRELGRRNDVHLLAFHHRDELPSGESVDRSKRELGKFCSAIEYFDLWPKRSMAHRFIALAGAVLHPDPFSFVAHRSRALARRIATICSESPRPDVVHLDTIALAPYLRWCHEVPVVLAHHNIESQLMGRRSDFEQGILQRAYIRREASKLRRSEATYCGRFPLNITVSDADAMELRSICPGAVTAVVPNGVDISYFAPRAEMETQTVVFAGGMGMFANRDGVDWFLESVWPLVTERMPGTRFLAIGRRQSSRLLEAATRDGRIESPGFVEDIRPSVASCAVYVVPLRVGGGTRLKVLDAMAQGKAIVSSTVGAEGIDVKDGEHLLIADGASSFAERVVELLRDPGRRRQLGNAARGLAVEKYSWEILGERLEAAYFRVTGRRER